VHPELVARLDLPAGVLLGEIDLALASGAPAPAATYRPIPRVPAAVRDLSVVLDPGAEAGAVVAAFEGVAAPAPVSFVWLDRYAGPPLSTGQVAMTLRVILQPLDRTLNDAEAEAFRARLLTVLDMIPGARLRRIDT
jgi:phenylalanyl-tRNA synthetase beta chain